MNFGLFQNAPQIGQTDFNQANASGGMQADAAQMAKQQAQGIGVSPADLQMRAGLMQAQRANAAQAVSTRGNFGLAGAQRMAQASGAGMQQNMINQAAQMRAQEQNAALGQYLQAATQKRAADLQQSGQSQQEAIQQAQLEQQANAANQSESNKILGGIVGGATSLLGAGAMFSDERAKADAYQQGALSGFAEGVRQWTADPAVRAVIAKQPGHAQGIRMQNGGMWMPTDKGYVPMTPGLPGQATAPAPATDPDAHFVKSSSVDQQRPARAYTTYDPQTGQPIAPPAPPPAPPAPDETSDARAKAPQQGASNAANAFMDSLQPRAFTWKDQSVAPNPQAAQQPNLGVYAQDVEKSPWGQAIVQQDPATGYKQLDMKALMGALAASAGETHRQQQEHEQRLAALESVVRGSRGGS